MQVLFAWVVIVASSNVYSIVDSCKCLEIQDTIKSDILALSKIVDTASLLSYINVVWPGCIKEKRIYYNVDSVNKVQLKIANFWLDKLLDHLYLYNRDSIVIFRDEGNSDYIAGYSLNRGYAQFVDGKTLSVLVKRQFKWNDTAFIKKNIVREIGNYILLNSLTYNINNINVIIKMLTTHYTEGTLGINDSENNKLKNMRDVNFIVTSKYLIINVPKIISPYPGREGYVAHKIIGGIDLKDKRPFYRFNKTANFNFETELLRIFPWIPESTQVWKEKNEKNGSWPLLYIEK